MIYFVRKIWKEKGGKYSSTSWVLTPLSKSRVKTLTYIWKWNGAGHPLLPYLLAEWEAGKNHIIILPGTPPACISRHVWVGKLALLPIAFWSQVRFFSSLQDSASSWTQGENNIYLTELLGWKGMKYIEDFKPVPGTKILFMTGRFLCNSF